MRGTPRTTVYPIIFLMLLVAAAACVDGIPVTSPEEVTKEEVTEPAGNPSVVASVTCTANVTAGELSCGKVPVVDIETGVQRIIVGGQGMFVELFSPQPFVSYNPTTQIFQADVYLENYITQGLGSADGLTTTGIRVFTHSGPTVTSTTPPGGTATVTVANADGTGTFTGANQPFHLYDQYLPAADPPSIFYPTDTLTWQWNVPTNVNTFVFEVFVDADVVNPNGYVLMSPGSLLMSVGGGTQTVTGTPADVVGRGVITTVTYSSSDPTIANVNSSTGEVTAVNAGIVDIIGTTGGPEADGRTRVTIDPPTAGFDIDLHFITPVSATQAAAFTAAAARWGGLITGDLATEQVDIPIILCGGLVDEHVDDLAINVLLDSIDGPGDFLAFAGPCWFRPTGAGGLPAFGFMVFDTADVAGLEADGRLDDLVAHEMGHVLGIGTLWDNGLLNDETGPLTSDECFPGGEDPPPPLMTDPFFSGPQ
ncbi:MAG: Ig-like domain-containing protein, partial [Gemmatimonadota bacterium]|nr:Ig-like domain-containing protein [Gemmatimonadota bacterium]